MPAPAARRTAVLAAIAVLHVGAFIAASAGLRPPQFLDWLREGAITALPPSLPRIPETRPDPVGAPEVDPGAVTMPDLSIPVSVDPPPAGAARQDSGQDGAATGAAVPLSDDRDPGIRTRDARLQALIDRCYPAAARRMGQEGRGVARVDVDAAGRAGGWRVERSTGFPLLDPGMGCVARQLQYEPARRGGRAVEATVLMPIVFQLR
jgi:protein TonB